MAIHRCAAWANFIYRDSDPGAAGPRAGSRWLMPATILTLLVAYGCAADDPAATAAPGIGSWSVKEPVEMTEGRILDALRGGDHAAALKQANLILAARPSDGRWWCYAASADHALGDDRSAVDAYMRGACLAGATYLDSEMLYRRAQALFGVRSYARAQSQLRVLSDRFPYSRLAASDIDLSNRVTARLAQGVSQDNLKWYWKEAREARHRSHEGLAAEYFEEYLLLSERMHLPDQERVIGCRLLLGDTYLALGAPASALDQFEHVEPSIQSGRGALFRALALLALHRNEEARTMAELAWKSVDPRIASDGEKVYSLANRPFK